MNNIDYQVTSLSIKEAINDSPKKSKRVLLKTLLKMYGHKTRKTQWIELMQHTLEAVGVATFPLLADAGRDDWVVLSVISPSLPVRDFTKDCTTYFPDDQSLPCEDNEWLNCIAMKTFNSEKEVEIRFVLPLLEHLGYTEDDRADGYPVEQVVGVRKSRTEADFVLFDGLNRSKGSALLVVEAKNVGKALHDHIGQARSYAMFLGAPYYLVTNGDDIRVFLYRSPIEADVEVFKSCRNNILKTFKTMYNLISKRATIEYRRKKSSALQ